MSPAIQSELARDHFLKALLLADLRVQTLLAHPKFLLEALELATGREMLCAGASGAAVNNTPEVRATCVDDPNTAEPAWVGELTQLVRALTVREKQRPRPRQRLCWGCGQLGHLVSHCPHAATEQGNKKGSV